MRLSIEVDPIRPGYSYDLTLVLPETLWEAEQLATGRLVAHFRDHVPGPLVWQADSEAGTIARDADAREIAITIPAEATAGFTRAVIVFDIARFDDEADDARVVPGTYQWPVRKAVTRDVD